MQTGRKNKLLNNDGFSLTELIVVIAIIALLGGVIGFSAYNASRYNVKKMAETFDKGLSRTQTLCMGKDNNNTFVVLYKSNSSVMMKVTRLDKDGAEISDTKEWDLGSSGNKVTYLLDAEDASAIELGDNQAIAVSFDRASGAFKEMIDMSDLEPVLIEDETTKVKSLKRKDNTYLKEVIFGEDNNAVKVTLYPSTGKHKIG